MANGPSPADDPYLDADEVACRAVEGSSINAALPCPWEFVPLGDVRSDFGHASVVSAPRGASFPEASTLLLNATTAQLSLDALGLPPETTISSFGSSTDTALFDRLRTRAQDGILMLRVGEVPPASQAVEAHRRLTAGGIRGRLVLDFSQPL